MSKFDTIEDCSLVGFAYKISEALKHSDIVFVSEQKGFYFAILKERN